MSSEWKTIKYRGGLVEFRIPRSWVEEYGEDGGGTFYEPTPDSDTLRLTVLTFRSREPVSSETPREILGSRSEQQRVSLVYLPNGNALIAYSAPGEEEGVELLIHYWELANVVPPDHARLAVFSFTTRAAEPERAARDLEWLHREIGASRFSRDLGIVSG